MLGILTQADLLDEASRDRSGPRIGLARRLRLTLERGRAPHGRVADIMSPVEPVRPETPVAGMVLRMADAGLHHLPAVGADGRLVGIVSRTDLVAALMADAADEGGAAGETGTDLRPYAGDRAAHPAPA